MTHHTRSHAPHFIQSDPAVTRVQQKFKFKPTEKKRPWGTVPRGSAESMERVPVDKPAEPKKREATTRGSPSFEGCGEATAPADSSSVADDDEGSFEEDTADGTLVPARSRDGDHSMEEEEKRQTGKPAPHFIRLLHEGAPSGDVSGINVP